MKKAILSAIFLIVFYSGVLAQSITGFSGGILGGANLSEFNNSDVNYKSRWGWDLGLWVNVPIVSMFSIEPQLLHSQRTYETDPRGSSVGGDIGYFSIPVLAKVTFGKFAIMAGPEFNFISTFDDSRNIYQRHDFKDTSTAITAGVEFFTGSKFSIYAKYNFGLVDMYRRDDNGPQINPNPIPTSDYKNQSVHFGLKWKIFEKSLGAAKPVAAATATPDKDSDGDGIVDSKDKCPNTKGIADNYGCPEIIIYYTTNDANLSESDKTGLDKVVNFMNKNPELDIEIEGHASAPGTAEYNQKISETRAKSAVDYLVSKGIPAKRLSWKGYGETRPIGDNSTEAERAKNRRVVMRIKK